MCPLIFKHVVGAHEHPFEKLGIELCGAAEGALLKHERKHHSHIEGIGLMYGHLCGDEAGLFVLFCKFRLNRRSVICCGRGGVVRGVCSGDSDYLPCFVFQRVKRRIRLKNRFKRHVICIRYPEKCFPFLDGMVHFTVCTG